MESFQDRLRSARSAAKKAQADVAGELGITVSGYASWEQGRTRPNIEMLRRLCRTLKVSADFLLGLSDENS